MVYVQRVSSHLVNSHIVNSHFIDVDELGIGEVVSLPNGNEINGKE